MLRDVNRNPRRWGDESGRVRVVEGWHPSEPGRVGYNVLLDDSWLGTFETLDRAASAAAALHVSGGGPMVRLHAEYGVLGGQSDRPRVHVVEPTPNDK